MEFKIQSPIGSGTKFKIKGTKFITSDLIKVLLENRGVKTEKEIEEFLNPRLEKVTIKSVGIDKKQLNKAVSRIRKAIENEEQIVVFGDYDVDGICGTAILWETLHGLGADVMPYIPHRIEEGYGLSLKGISNVKCQMSNVKLIITVDNGIVANKAVKFANKEGIDVIISDHHVPSKKLPDAYAVVHTTKLCGAGVAWMLAQSILHVIPNLFRDLGSTGTKILKQVQNDIKRDTHIELVALATIADLVPLIGANRTFVKFGLEALRRTRRIGLLELFKEAGLSQSTIGVYEVGHMIAPRLNAMGRLEYAMDSLRLLCTKNQARAKSLAEILGNTNRERQELTLATFENSKLKTQNSKLQLKTQKLLFIADASYQQGVIGLVAGKLVEEFYRPSIVVSVGEKYSKASARSVAGFNIIEFIRTASEFLVDAGGHPMAAGFTVETSKLSILKKVLEEKAEAILDKEKLTRTLRIDCELELSAIDEGLYKEVQKLAPFGMGNPEPTFISKNVVIEDIRVVGAERKHIKLRFKIYDLRFMIDGIAFGMGERANEFHVGDTVDIAYTIDLNVWNGNSSLQIKIKDIKQNKLPSLNAF